jgi:hypothetical protein
MALPGECVNDTNTTCHECGTELRIDILKSAAGYFRHKQAPHHEKESRGQWQRLNFKS